MTAHYIHDNNMIQNDPKEREKDEFTEEKQTFPVQNLNICPTN